MGPRDSRKKTLADFSLADSLSSAPLLYIHNSLLRLPAAGRNPLEMFRLADASNPIGIDLALRWMNPAVLETPAATLAGLSLRVAVVYMYV